MANTDNKYMIDTKENREFLQDLLDAMYEELPVPKKKK